MERLRQGDPAAVEQLWARERNAIWSLCVAMTGERVRAVDLLQSLFQDLPRASRGFSAEAPLCCGLAAWLWRDLGGLLELAPLGGITPVPPGHSPGLAENQVAVRLAALEPSVRLVYLVDLYFGCPAGRLSDLVAVPEPDLRAARTHAVWGMLAGGGR